MLVNLSKVILLVGFIGLVASGVVLISISDLASLTHFGWKLIVLFIVIFGVVACAFSLRRPRLRGPAAALLVLACIIISGAEYYLSRPEQFDIRYQYWSQLGIDFVSHTAADEVALRRRAGEDIHLPFSPADYFNNPVLVEGTPTIPMTGISSSSHVVCNEAGIFETKKTDKFGFHNPENLWDRENGTDFLVIGDALADGWCVDSKNGLVDIFRARYPSTVNISRTGLGPLSELATLREYGQNASPKYILWMFSENDLNNLEAEWEVPILRRYLDDTGFTQELVKKNNLVSKSLARDLENKFDNQMRRRQLPFRGIRNFLNRFFADQKSYGDSSRMTQAETVATLKKLALILKAAIQDSQDINAELIFIYLRNYKVPHGTKQWTRLEQQRQDITELVKSLRIKIFDPTESVLNKFENSQEMHRLTENAPLNQSGNLRPRYNESGHRTVAHAIENFISKFAPLS